MIARDYKEKTGKPSFLLGLFIQISYNILRHIGLLEADEDKIRKIRPKGTLVTILYVPREAIYPKGGYISQGRLTWRTRRGERSDPSLVRQVNLPRDI